MAVCMNIIYGPSADDTVPDPTNNVIIPAIGKPKLKIEPVYGDDGVQVAYYEYSLTIDTVLYLPTAVLADIEAEARRIELILTTPGLKLVVYPVGLGTIPVVNGTTGKPDVKGGPFPQNVAVEPIGGSNAISLSWGVMFRINHCPTNLADLVQFNSEYDIDVDDEGDVVCNFRATYQRRTPIQNLTAISPLMDAFLVNLGTSFQGMKRRKRSSLSRDQRTLHVHIEYKTVKSDSPFFEGTRNIDFVDEMSSDLFSKGAMSPKGFMSWTRKFSATITMPPRVHKSYAWYVFLKIVKQRMRRLKQFNKVGNLLDANPTAGQNGKAGADKNKYILTRIRIRNPVYTRQMSFDLEYFVITDLDNLIDKTKIFSRVNTAFNDPGTDNNPKTMTEQWVIWDTASNIALNGSFGYAFNLPITYVQCTGSSTAPGLGATLQLPFEDDPDAPSVGETSPGSPGATIPGGSENPPVAAEQAQQEDDLKYTWIAYVNKFAILEKTNNQHVRYLQETTATYYQSDEASATMMGSRDSEGFSVNAKYSDSGGTPPKTVNRGTSTYTLRMRGYAIRLKNKIPIPVVTSVGGLAVSRLGTSRAMHQQISHGNPPVYLAVWDVTYAIDKDIQAQDIMSEITTNGVPGHFL